MPRGDDLDALFFKLIALVIMTIAVCLSAVHIVGHVANYNITKQAMENGYSQEVISKIPYRIRWVKKKDIPTLEI